MTNAPASRKPSILVIEDNPADVELLRLAFTTADFDCDLTVVEDGEEALALVRQDQVQKVPPYDLAILDLNLPKSGGLEIIEAMRDSAVFAQVPVVVLSSSLSVREREVVSQFGIKLHIAKPSDLDTYLEVGSLVKQLVLENRSIPDA